MRSAARLPAGAAVAAAIVLLLLPSTAGAREPLFERGKPTGSSAGVRYAPGALLVTYKRGGLSTAALSRVGGRLDRRIAAIRTDLVRVPVGTERRAVARLRRDARVRTAMRDPIVPFLGGHASCVNNSRCLIPNDPGFSAQWYLQNDARTDQPDGSSPVFGADIAAPLAWAITLGDPATRIAIVDTGVEGNHPDLGPRIVEHATLDSNMGIEDNAGHGTSVAGVAAAIPNNGIGIAGVAANASLMNIKVARDFAGDSASCGSISAGIVFAVDNGARVINVSAGSNTPCGPMEDAVNYAWNNDRLVVAAAGNDGTDKRVYPAAYSNALSVAATDNGDRRADFSSFGSWVLLAAPGAQIVTTATQGRYAIVDGTSFSAPIVSGVAALVWPNVRDENGDGFRSDDLAGRLLRNADKIAGTGRFWRFGRVNACRAAAAGADLCPPPGTAPTGGQGSTTPRLSSADARRYTREILRSRYGTLFTKGKGYKAKCKRSSAARVKCAVSWRRSPYRYSGSVSLHLRVRNGRLVADATVKLARRPL